MNSNLTTMVQVTKFDVVNWLLWMIKTNINKQAIFFQTAGKRYQHRDFIKHTSCKWSDEELSVARRGVARIFPQVRTTFQISLLPSSVESQMYYPLIKDEVTLKSKAFYCLWNDVRKLQISLSTFWVYLTINEWGWVSYEELWRSRRVLSVEAVGRGG